MKMTFPFIILLLGFSHHLLAQTYVEGNIITHTKDTIPYKILKHKNRKEEVNQSFLVIQTQNDSGKVKTLYPGDIAGYIKAGEYFRSLCTRQTKDAPAVNIFIQQVTKGRAELYMSLHQGLHHYFKKSNAKEFLVWEGEIVCSVQEVGANNSNSGNAAGITQWRVTQNADAFRDYFMRYFADCPLVVNKLKSAFYAEGELKAMFIDYNEEGKRLNKKSAPANQ